MYNLIAEKKIKITRRKKASKKDKELFFHKKK